MTEQVQPLTLQKTTNLEEHQQFFSKINEIIDNLAPTVEEAEAATASAEQAIADADTAIANANSAIANANAAVSTANAASSQAQAAATTVAGFDARLTAVEDTAVRNRSTQVQVIDSDLQVVNGHDLAVAGDVNVASQVVAEGAEIAGLAIEKSGSRTVLSNEDGITVTGVTTVQVPLTATGSRDTQAVNGSRLQNDLDAYEHMVRTSGAQTISGSKDFTSTIGRSSTSNQYTMIAKRNDIDMTAVPATTYQDWFALRDMNNTNMIKLQARAYADGRTGLFLSVLNSDGSTKTAELLVGDVV